jgi:hypothetical protein
MTFTILAIYFVLYAFFYFRLYKTTIAQLSSKWIAQYLLPFGSIFMHLLISPMLIMMMSEIIDPLASHDSGIGVVMFSAFIGIIQVFVTHLLCKAKFNP